MRGEPPQEVLLGRKKRGFGEGKIVGLGGKVEPGETLAQAAVREVLEESGIVVSEEHLDRLHQIVLRARLGDGGARLCGAALAG